MKILIAVPTFETISPETFKSIYQLDRGKNACYFDFIRGYDCATARNKIAEKALKEEVDYVLSVDNDIAMPIDALVNLLSHEEEVVIGYYVRRNDREQEKPTTCVYKYIPAEVSYITRFSSSELTQARDSGQYKIRIHGGGMGCSLIKTDVFKKIGYPYYDWVNYHDSGRSILSEDLYFCEKCKKVGIPIYVDTRVACGHLFRYLKGV